MISGGRFVPAGEAVGELLVAVCARANQTAAAPERKVEHKELPLSEAGTELEDFEDEEPTPE